jgi:hypothetical protein
MLIFATGLPYFLQISELLRKVMNESETGKESWKWKEKRIKKFF